MSGRGVHDLKSAIRTESRKTVDCAVKKSEKPRKVEGAINRVDSDDWMFIRLNMYLFHSTHNALAWSPGRVVSGTGDIVFSAFFV